MPPSPKLNQSVQKAVRLLQVVADGGGANVSALSRSVGLPRPTVVRLLQTLEADGLLIRASDSDQVLLGPELGRLARKADVGAMLSAVARRPLQELVATIQETTSLSIVAPDGDLDVVLQIDGPHHLRPRQWTGQRFPLHASSSGKVLLASYGADRLRAFTGGGLEQLTPFTITSGVALRRELSEVRARSYSVTSDELEEGLSGASVGVFSSEHELLGVINVSGATQRLGRSRLDAIAAQLLLAARRVEELLTREPPVAGADGSPSASG